MPPNGKGGAEAECRGAAGVLEKLCLFCAEPQITAKGLGVCGEAELSCTPRSTFPKAPGAVRRRMAKGKREHRSLGWG